MNHSGLANALTHVEGRAEPPVLFIELKAWVRHYPDSLAEGRRRGPGRSLYPLPGGKKAAGLSGPRAPREGGKGEAEEINRVATGG